LEARLASFYVLTLAGGQICAMTLRGQRAAVVRATAITPEPVAGRAGHGIHRAAEDARLVRKEWADCAELPQDARAQIIPISRGATDRAGQPTGEQNGGSRARPP
jgi:hypothetical protein